jgi:hypothetical protein
LNGYIYANEFVSLWDDGEVDTFKADPPYAIFTKVNGVCFHEAELLIITGVEKVGDCRSIAYKVQLEAGEQPNGVVGIVRFFVDLFA